MEHQNIQKTLCGQQKIAVQQMNVRSQRNNSKGGMNWP